MNTLRTNSDDRMTHNEPPAPPPRPAPRASHRELRDADANPGMDAWQCRRA